MNNEPIVFGFGAFIGFAVGLLVVFAWTNSLTFKHDVGTTQVVCLWRTDTGSHCATGAEIDRWMKERGR